MGRDFSPAHVMTTRAGGEPEIGLIRASISPTETVQGGTFQVSAAWASGPEVTRQYDVCINLIAGDDEVVQSQCQPLAPSWPTDVWQANEIVAGNYTVEVSPYSNAGPHTVTMTVQDGDGSAIVGNSAAVGNLNVNAYPRVFAEPELAVPANLTWGEELALPGYELAFPEADSLAVTLYWRALQRMDTSYTAFLHLKDPATEEIVAQADVIPRGWSYPTNWWEAGELVEDTVWLSLEGVPPGEYDLFVGWYDLESGERLPAFSGSGEIVADGSVYLTTLSR